MVISVNGFNDKRLLAEVGRSAICVDGSGTIKKNLYLTSSAHINIVLLRNVKKGANANATNNLKGQTKGFNGKICAGRNIASAQP